MGKSKRLAAQSQSMVTAAGPWADSDRRWKGDTYILRDKAWLSRARPWNFPEASARMSTRRGAAACGIWPHCNTQLVEMYLKQPWTSQPAPPSPWPAGKSGWAGEEWQQCGHVEMTRSYAFWRKKKSHIHHPPGSPRRRRGGGQERAGTFSGRVLVTVTKQSSGDSGRMQGLRSQASLNKLDDLGEEGPSWRLSNGWIWGRHTIKDDTLVGGWEGEERGQNLGFCSLSSSGPPFLNSLP